MSSDKLIENFEVKCGWGTAEVMVSEYKEGHRLEHRYYSVPKCVVMKLLDASKQPTVSDFDGWVKDEAQKEKKKQAAHNGGAIASNDWWNQR